MIDTIDVSSPLNRYQQAITAGNYQADDAQYHAVQQLNDIYYAVKVKQKRSSSVRGISRVLFFWERLFCSMDTCDNPIKGLYMWGGVGRGKTWLLDLFYESVPGDRKLRLHFHRFMLHVHEALARLQGQSDPLERVADEFKARADVLCFDEFFVTDITDAMLLGKLFEALFARQIVLVVTTNIEPDRLYHNGLQRTRFLPAIELIKQHCQIVQIDAGVDYRLRTLTQANLFVSPLGVMADEIMQTLFHKLSGGSGKGAQILEINHHVLDVLNVADGVMSVDFSVLCLEARSPRDYIELSRLYHSVLLHNVQPMGEAQEDVARRFIALVDEFYERRVKLIISSAVKIENIYHGQRLRFEFKRCFSRLQEMQSEEYLKLGHLP